MLCSSYSYRGGLDELGHESIVEIKAAIESCPVVPKARSASKIRSHILNELSQRGWSGEFPIDPVISGVTITSIRDRAGLCIQTGNMARMYADLLKLQKLYLDDKARVGALILPSSAAAKQMGDNIANTDRLQSELDVFKKVVYMPFVIFSFE